MGGMYHGCKGGNVLRVGVSRFHQPRWGSKVRSEACKRAQRQYAAMRVAQAEINQGINQGPPTWSLPSQLSLQSCQMRQSRAASLPRGHCFSAAARCVPPRVPRDEFDSWSVVK